jgi:hypothetical protein
MSDWLRRVTWGGAAILIAGGAAVAFAQDRVDRYDGGGSLAALTAEIRQLRLAVEELAKGSTQTQALAVYASLQQSRALSSQILGLEDDLARGTTPERRAQIEMALRDLKREQEQTDDAERQARSREGELYQALQLEESRWSDVISRLEQVIKR